MDRLQPTVEGEPIPALPWEGNYKYWGVGWGQTQGPNLKQASNDYLADCEAIFKSDLTDWQNLDAIHHLPSHAVYLLQNSNPSVGWAKSIDKATRTLVKLYVKLPCRAVSSFLYTHSKAGSLGLPYISLFPSPLCFQAHFCPK